MAFPLGLDYSQGWPTGSAVKAAGYSFVARYLANGLAGRTNLTSTEVQSMRAAGVDVAVVWERKIIGQPDRVTEGRPAGTADAQAALARVQDIGLPDQPVYFAVDFDLPDYAPGNPDARAKLGQVAAYFDGVLSVLPKNRVGVYGGYWAVKRVLDAGLAAYAWQTAAWSGGQEDPRIHLFQRIGTTTVAGVGCDINEARQADYGQNGATVTSPQEFWEYPINNPNYSATAAEGTGESKKTFPAYDYMVVADMTAQQLAKDMAVFVASASAAFAALAAQLTSVQSQLAALKPTADASGTYTASGDLTLTRKQD